MFKNDQLAQLEKWNVSRETLSKLEIYHDLVLKWTDKINLISPSTKEDIWQRHFWDSLALYPLIKDETGRILDFGSGGGFPALVLACAGIKNIECIESDAKKCHFLKEVARQCDLSIKVHNLRIESLKEIKADLIISRACASLTELLNLTKGLLHEKGKAFFLKGKKSDEEIKHARQIHQFDVKLHPLKNDNDGVVLEIFLTC